VIAYALPAHTSGKPQPLDVSIFSPFKSKLNDCIHSIAMTNSAMTYDVFDFCKLVTEAYKQVFTEANIKSAFRKKRIRPLNPQMLLGKPMPKSSSEASTLLSVTEVCNVLEEKQAEIRRGLNIQPAVVSRGFISSTHGANLIATDAMKLARDSHEASIIKKISKDAAAIVRSDKRKARNDAAIHACVARERSAQLRRTTMYGIPVEVWMARPFRSLEKRRADAKLLTKLRQRRLNSEFSPAAQNTLKILENG
jgi:hypothetical protein